MIHRSVSSKKGNRLGVKQLAYRYFIDLVKPFFLYCITRMILLLHGSRTELSYLGFFSEFRNIEKTLKVALESKGSRVNVLKNTKMNKAVSWVFIRINLLN